MSEEQKAVKIVEDLIVEGAKYGINPTDGSVHYLDNESHQMGEAIIYHIDAVTVSKATPTELEEVDGITTGREFSAGCAF